MESIISVLSWLADHLAEIGAIFAAILALVAGKKIVVTIKKKRRR